MYANDIETYKRIDNGEGSKPLQLAIDVFIYLPHALKDVSQWKTVNTL